MLSEGAWVYHLAPNILSRERLELVSRNHEVWEGVEGEGTVVVPVHWAGVQGKGGQVGLAGDRLGKVSANVSGLWKVDRVPAHLCYNILPEYDNLLGAELDTGRIS